MCGGISQTGTPNGMPKNGGSNTVAVGIIRIRFDFCLRKNVAVSFVFNMIIIDATNIIHSIVTFVGLLMSMVVPKYCVVIGHRS